LRRPAVEAERDEQQDDSMATDHRRPQKQQQQEDEPSPSAPSPFDVLAVQRRDSFGSVPSLVAGAAAAVGADGQQNQSFSSSSSSMESMVGLGLLKGWEDDVDGQQHHEGERDPLMTMPFFHPGSAAAAAAATNNNGDHDSSSSSSCTPAFRPQQHPNSNNRSTGRAFFSAFSPVLPTNRDCDYYYYYYRNGLTMTPTEWNDDPTKITSATKLHLSEEENEPAVSASMRYLIPNGNGTTTAAAAVVTAAGIAAPFLPSQSPVTAVLPQDQQQPPSRNGDDGSGESSNIDSSTSKIKSSGAQKKKRKKPTNAAQSNGPVGKKRAKKTNGTLGTVVSGGGKQEDEQATPAADAVGLDSEQMQTVQRMVEYMHQTCGDAAFTQKIDGIVKYCTDRHLKGDATFMHLPGSILDHLVEVVDGAELLQIFRYATRTLEGVKGEDGDDSQRSGGVVPAAAAAAALPKKPAPRSKPKKKGRKTTSASTEPSATATASPSSTAVPTTSTDPGSPNLLQLGVAYGYHLARLEGRYGSGIRQIVEDGSDAVWKMSPEERRLFWKYMLETTAATNPSAAASAVTAATAATMSSPASSEKQYQQRCSV